MAERILLFGSGGQVGSDVRPLLAPLGDVVALDRADVDLRDAAAVRDAVRSVRPSWLINAAAYTAVDRAEAEREAAHAINAVAPAVMAEEAARLDARMVHFSTDYVYPGDGTRPYREDDPTGPLGVYGKTKLEGDQAVLGEHPAAVIVRTSWVYGVHGHNFVKTMLRLAGEGRTHLRVVADQRGVPTHSRTLAEATVAALGHDVPGGVYHVTDRGDTTWHGLAEALFAERARLLPEAPPVTVVPISTAEYSTAARRPAYSVLDVRRWEALGVSHGHPWRDRLAQTLAELLASTPPAR